MRWDLPAIVGFAERAGYWGAHLAEAAAVAWVVSGGDDLAHVPAAGDRPAYIGLFGIPASPFDSDEDTGALLNPQRNADAAWETWQESGRTFAWSPAPTSSAWPMAIAAAADAVERSRRAQVATVFGTVPPSGVDVLPRWQVDNGPLADLFATAQAINDYLRGT